MKTTTTTISHFVIFVDFSIFLFKFTFLVDKFSWKTTLELYGLFLKMNLIHKCILVNLWSARNNSITKHHIWLQSFFPLYSAYKRKPA